MAKKRVRRSQARYPREQLPDPLSVTKLGGSWKTGADRARALRAKVAGSSWLFRIATREGAWLQRGYGVAALLLLLLAGCAASAPSLSPAEYSFHSVALPPAEYPATYPLPSVVPQIELHWRLIVDSNRVRADGLIERQRESHIKDVWLQLVGIDETGQTVSFTPPTQFSWRSASALESFTIALKPRGGEKRYEVRLYMFEFEPQLTH